MPSIKTITMPITLSLVNITRTITTKIDTIQAAHKAAAIEMNRLPYTNLNISPYSEVTIYTDSYPEGRSASIRLQGKRGRPNLNLVNQKLVASGYVALALKGKRARRNFYYKHQENCLCSTDVSSEEVDVKNTRVRCKMTKAAVDMVDFGATMDGERTALIEIEIVVEVEEMYARQSLRTASIASLVSLMSLWSTMPPLSTRVGNNSWDWDTV